MNIARYHCGGLPITKQIAITTQYDIESRKKFVKYIAGMSGDGLGVANVTENLHQ